MNCTTDGCLHHAETHGAHRPRHVMAVVELMVLLDILSNGELFQAKTFEPGAQQSGGCAGHQSGTRPRSILALLGVWVLHLKIAFRHAFLRLPIYLTWSKDPAGGKRILRIPRITKVWRITVTGSAWGSRRELEEEEVSLVGYHIRRAALTHPEKWTSNNASRENVQVVQWNNEDSCSWDKWIIIISY